MPEARVARMRFWWRFVRANESQDTGTPTAKADGPAAVCEQPGEQVLSVRIPGPEESPAGEWWSAQDRAAPLRLQQAIWHCGSSDSASRESTGTGPNRRISARPIVRRSICIEVYTVPKAA